MRFAGSDTRTVFIALALLLVGAAVLAAPALGATPGKCVAWGLNDYGQASPLAGEYTAIAGGHSHSLALRSDGSIVAWGDNRYGQASPPAGTGYTAIAAGGKHSLALRPDGSIVGWGDNLYGAATPPSGTGYLAIAAGEQHSMALRSDGAIVCWGYNKYGQAPALVAGEYTAIAAGYSHSMALRSDGSIVCWGENFNGQASPPPGIGYATIAAGYNHNLARRSDGSIAAWGWNVVGQASPPAGTGYTAIAAGYGHSIALRPSGSIAAWGWNLFGLTPPPAGTMYTAIASGGWHGLALTTDATAPVTSLAANSTPTSGWYRSAVQVTLTATDNDPATVITTKYTLDGGAEQTYTAPFTVSGDGVHTLAYHSVDTVGNTETAQTAIISIDTTAPVISITAPADGAVYAVGQFVTAAWSATDTGSDLASALGTVANGGAVDTSVPGSKTFTVTATDRMGNTATVTTHYSVHIPPAAGFGAYPQSGPAPLPVRFLDYTPDAKAWSWDFGDGETSAEQNPTHVYTRIGWYSVTLTATTWSGETRTKTAYQFIRVTEAPTPSPTPLANFSANATAGPAPLAIAFSDVSSPAPYHRWWQFGDGGTSTDANPVHVYTTPGTRTVNLTVWTAIGQATKTGIITVGPDSRAPVANFTVSRTSGTAPLYVKFTDASTGAPTSWRWDFGGLAWTALRNPSAIFRQPGTCAVTLTVRNAYGSSSATKNLTVLATPGRSRAATDAPIQVVG
jgi:PKD repeat protein